MEFSRLEHMLNSELEASLAPLQEQVLPGIRIKSSFQRTPEKPYTARATFEMVRGGRSVKDIPVVLFLPGDATGDDSLYKRGSVLMERGILHAGHQPQDYHPRSKTSLTMEVAIPLFSLYTRDDGNVKALKGRAPLDILTIAERGQGPTVIAHFAVDGIVPCDEERARRAGAKGYSAWLTTGYKKDGSRILDPHAIAALTPPQPVLDLARVAAFVGFSRDEAKFFGNEPSFWYSTLVRDAREPEVNLWIRAINSPV